MPFEDLPDEEVGSRQLDDDTLASYQKQFNYSAEELDSVLRVLGENGEQSVRWAMTRLSPCSPASRALSTITSVSSSPSD